MLKGITCIWHPLRLKLVFCCKCLICDNKKMLLKWRFFGSGKARYLIRLIEKVFHSLSHSTQKSKRIPKYVKPKYQDIELFDRLASIMTTHFWSQLRLVVEIVLSLKKSKPVKYRQKIYRNTEKQITEHFLLSKKGPNCRIQRIYMKLQCWNFA